MLPSILIVTITSINSFKLLRFSYVNSEKLVYLLVNSWVISVGIIVDLSEPRIDCEVPIRGLIVFWSVSQQVLSYKPTNEYSLNLFHFIIFCLHHKILFHIWYLPSSNPSTVSTVMYKSTLVGMNLGKWCQFLIPNWRK